MPLVVEGLCASGFFAASAIVGFVTTWALLQAIMFVTTSSSSTSATMLTKIVHYSPSGIVVVVAVAAVLLAGRLSALAGRLFSSFPFDRLVLAHLPWLLVALLIIMALSVAARGVANLYGGEDDEVIRFMQQDNLNVRAPNRCAHVPTSPAQALPSRAARRGT